MRSKEEGEKIPGEALVAWDLDKSVRSQTELPPRGVTLSPHQASHTIQSTHRTQIISCAWDVTTSLHYSEAGPVIPKQVLTGYFLNPVESCSGFEQEVTERCRRSWCSKLNTPSSVMALGSSNEHTHWPVSPPALWLCPPVFFSDRAHVISFPYF